MLQLPVYLDYNATTPVNDKVLKAMLPYFSDHFGNAASRNHAFGWTAAEAVEFAREQVAGLIHAEPKEIIFTSGATEANNLALKGVYEMYASKGNHIITCVTEHKAVIDTCKHLEKLGASVTYLPVNADGLINLSELEAAIQPETVLIAIMYANNETGVIQPIKEIAAIAKKRGVLFFTDATQAVGKIPVHVLEDGVDLMAFTAHKMYGPKGVGALYVRRKNPRVKIAAQMDGGGHERGNRSGTLNVPGIVGFGQACENARLNMKEESKRLKALRDKLEKGLEQIEETYINGSKDSRMYHVCNVSFRHVEADSLLMAMNKSIAASSGSACSSASMEPSYVLKAMGLSDEMAFSSIRFSLGCFTTEEAIDYTLQQVTKAVEMLRAESPQWQLFKEAVQ